jgi:hypothetical protein
MTGVVPFVSLFKQTHWSTKMKLRFYAAPVRAMYSNDNDAYVPELWALESLAILEENMVIAGLVNRDFEDSVAKFGDVVNTRRPGEFNALPKTDADDITLQDATATNVQVPLNQHIHTSFVIKDGEWSKSFKDLVQEYLAPAVLSISQRIDRILLGQVHNFLGESAGLLGGMTSSNAVDYVLDAREVLNVNNAYTTGRNLIVTPYAETKMLQNATFHQADRLGDAGTALREASLGRKLGFDIYQCQQANYITDNSTETASGTVTSAAAAGTTGSQTVSIVGHEAAVGEYAVIVGNQQVDVISAATVGAGDTTAVTLVDALKYAILASAVIKVYKSADVNGAFSAGYNGPIQIDGFASGKGPQVGQLISFGTGGSRHTYTIVHRTITSATEVAVWLDRPLAANLANNDLAFPGPAGSLNLAFHRDALAFVNRPLALPDSRHGVMAGVMSDRNASMRVTMQYNSTKQGTIVTVDTLCGVKTLDTNLGCVLLS